jgi:FMN phosphatase YigB (HAD superfamily)
VTSLTMPGHRWFIFDLGNVLIRLAYRRVIAAVCDQSEIPPEEMIALLEGAGGYRDLERGSVSFQQLHDLLRDRAGYRGGVERLREIWTDFFDGPVEGIDRVLQEVRRRYRVAFLSNSNEVHAEVIPRHFETLFEPEDVFVFSHELKCAKPDPRIFEITMVRLQASPQDCIYVDDLPENVSAAQAAGLTAYLFTGSAELMRRLREDDLIGPEGVR